MRSILNSWRSAFCKPQKEAIVDATIVNSPRKPHLPKVLEIADEREDKRSEAQKQQESDYHQQLRYTELGIDHEARFVKEEEMFLRI